MDAREPVLTPSEAARRLGMSTKALRIYEQRGLLRPARTAAGWRAYGPQQMTRLAEIAALRRLGLSLAQIGRVLGGEAGELEPALAAHQARLEAQLRALSATIAQVHAARAGLQRGELPAASALSRIAGPQAAIEGRFNLPWPWGGERFVFRPTAAITYIVGPLGSGKTRLARCIAAAIPGATFHGLDRSSDHPTPGTGMDPATRARAAEALDWLMEEGATASPALTALLMGLEAEGPSLLVVDMVEQGLDHVSQEALAAYLRRRKGKGCPLVLLTRSNAILDLSMPEPDETILYCPANHSPPFQVAAHPGAPGFEAVATCLASPEVRARTEGVVALRPQTVA